MSGVGSDSEEDGEEDQVANGETSMAAGVLDSVLMKFGKLVARVEFLVVDNPPFGIIIGFPLWRG